MLDLKTCMFFVGERQPFSRPDGKVLDFYTIANEGGSAVLAISCEGCRADIASFVVSSLQAGQKVLQQLKRNEPFGPHMATPDVQRTIKKVLFEEATPETVMEILSELALTANPQDVRNRMALLRHKRRS